MPLQLWDKNDFIPELTTNPRHLKLNRFNTHSFLAQAVGVLAQIQTLVHQSLKLKSSNGGSKSSSSGKFHPLKTHSILLSRIPS
jgi:hypothetical protein